MGPELKQDCADRIMPRTRAKIAGEQSFHGTASTMTLKEREVACEGKPGAVKRLDDQWQQAGRLPSSFFVP
eukprot:750145-Hanusia_phi.AAC.2